MRKIIIRIAIYGGMIGVGILAYSAQKGYLRQIGKINRESRNQSAIIADPKLPTLPEAGEKPRNHEVAGFESQATTKTLPFTSDLLTRIDDSKTTAGSRPDSVNRAELISKFANLGSSPVNRKENLELLKTLAYSGRGLDVASEAIIAYISAPIAYGELDSNEVMKIYESRIFAIRSLGVSGTPLARKFLEDLLSTEGYGPATKNWLKDMPLVGTHTTQSNIGAMRANAAQGLAFFSDDPDVRDLIVRAYEAERNKLVSADKVSSSAFNALIDARIYLDLREQLGTEAFVESFVNGDPETNLNAKFQLLGKYSLRSVRPSTIAH